jgi:hypothetical protein
LPRFLFEAAGGGAETLGAARLARRPNSSTTCAVDSSSDDCDVENVDRADELGERAALSLSRFDPEPPERRKFRPRIDLRPLFSSLSGVGTIVAVSRFGEGVAAGRTSALEPLREKKGMPDGVRREERTLERDFPGLVVTTAGVPCGA